MQPRRPLVAVALRVSPRTPERRSASRGSTRDPGTGALRSRTTEVSGRTRKEANELGLHRVGHGAHTSVPPLRA
eukprot:5983611-Alexandrium_andersonii.AAC.1